MSKKTTEISPNRVVLLEWSHVKERCKISRAEIYRRIKLKTFPPPIKLSPRKNVWPEYVIDKWINDLLKTTKYN
jgi:predicted DNA-binding transcriptional regulator AlpA